MSKFYLSFLLFIFINYSALAQWSMDPTVNTKVCDTAGLQKDVRLESDGAGGVFMVWRDYRKGTNSSDVYAQRLDSLGFPMWTPNGIGIVTLSADQSTPAIVSDDQDGVIIAWSDWRSGIERDIYAQRVDGNGNILWQTNGAVVTVKNDREHSEKIIKDDHSGIIAVWEQQRGNGTWDIWAQRIDSNGNEVWPAGGIPLVLEGSNRRNHKAQRDGNGGAIITWQDERSGTHDIYAQRIDAQGNRLWGNMGKAVCNASGVQNNPKIDPEKGSKGVYIVWADARSTTDYDIYAQRLDSNGNNMWGPTGYPVSTAPGNQSAVDILSNNKVNGVIITWKDSRNGNTDIYAQKLEYTGSPQWTANGVVVCNASGDQLNPNIVSDKDSGAIVVWQDERAADWDVYAQRIGKEGQMRWTANGEAVCTAIGDQEAPKNVPDNKGGTIVAWKDERTSNFDDIYAHHLFDSGSPNSVRDINSAVEQIEVFPNPMGDVINVKIGLSRTDYLGFVLYDLLGREVYNFSEYTQYFTKGKHQVRLDISNNNLSSGLYLLQVQGAEGGVSIKLIKE